MAYRELITVESAAAQLGYTRSHVVDMGNQDLLTIYATNDSVPIALWVDKTELDRKADELKRLAHARDGYRLRMVMKVKR